MDSSWAFIYGQPGAEPRADRFVIDRAGQRTTLVPVPDEAAAPTVALALLDEGVERIELCGGFGLRAAARVVEAIAGPVPVGHVSRAGVRRRRGGLPGALRGATVAWPHPGTVIQARGARGAHRPNTRKRRQ